MAISNEVKRHFWADLWKIARVRREPDYLDRLAFERNLLRNGAMQGTMFELRTERKPLRSGGKSQAYLVHIPAQTNIDNDEDN